MKMKKLAAAIAAALVLATSAVCLTACGGGAPAGNDTNVSAQQEAFVLEGTWQIVEATANGVDAMAAAKQMGMEDQMTVTFQNGVATVNLMGDITTGNYTYENGVLNLEGGIANITGNRIEFNVEGVHMVLEKSDTSVIGGADAPTSIQVTDSISSLAGTTWKITSMTEDGVEVSDQLNGATATFTADTMILSYGGETEDVEYTYENGVIDAEGITGTVSSTQIKFQQGNQIMIMEREGTASTPSTPADSSSLNTLVGSKWEVVKMTDGGEDVSDQLRDIGGIDVRFTADQMIMTANGLGESEYVDYTFENGVIDAEGIIGRISGDTITFAEDTEEMVMRRK